MVLDCHLMVLRTGFLNLDAHLDVVQQSISPEERLPLHSVFLLHQGGKTAEPAVDGVLSFHQLAIESSWGNMASERFQKGDQQPHVALT